MYAKNVLTTILVTDDCEGKMNEIAQWGLMLVER